MSVTPREAVDAANGAFGRHAGFRALHAKGILCSGTFTASAEAAGLTTAAHMQGEPVPVTARFSNGGGNPRVPDYAPDLRGMALKFYLPDGTRTDLVAVSSPVFASPTPEGFVALLEAQGAGAAAAIKLPLLFARNPGMLRRLARAAAAMRPPVSYGAVRYYGQHAFEWLDAGGGSRFVRYTLRPVGMAEGHLSPLAARRRGADYLQDDLRSRLAGGPVRFTLEVQIATPGDPIADPSTLWPAHRRRVEVGVVELDALEAGRERDGDVLVFDPSRLTAGIECSDDPVLRFRSPAYRESVARRAPETR
jgi:catalase